MQDRYGSADVLRVGDVPPPVPGRGEVLVRVRAASVHPDVWHVLHGQPYVLRLMGSGLRRPRNPVPGTDLAGVVDTVGPGVSRWVVGDEVFGETVVRSQWKNAGAYAELAVVPERALARKPEGVGFEEAAATPTSALIALDNLPPAVRERPGSRVLVNGAGGGVGTFVVQVAKGFGAHVTGVDTTSKLELVRSLGADDVIDFTERDFTQQGGDSPRLYDVIVDIPGNHSFAECRRVLQPHGTYVLIGHDQFGRVGRRWLGSLPRFAALLARAPFTEQLRPMNLSGAPKEESMALLADLLGSGRLTPVVGRTFPMEQVAEAMRCLESGRTTGKIVLTM